MNHSGSQSIPTATAGGYCPVSTARGYCPLPEGNATAGGHCPLLEGTVHCRRILSTARGYRYCPLPEDTLHCRRILPTSGGYCPLPEDTVHFRRILSSHLCSGPLLTPIVYIWYIINGQNSENTIGEEEMSKNGKLIYKDSIMRKLVTLPVIKLKFKIWEFCLLN